MLDRIQLVKRGVAFAGDCHQKLTQHVSVSQNPEDAEKFLNMLAEKFQTPGAIITLGLTLISAMVLLMSIEYSIRFVATNLAIVEHTEGSGSGRAALSDEPDAPLYKAPLLEDFEEDQKLPILEEAVALPIKPITTGLRSTIRHITSQEGFTARFRGLRLGFFYAFIFGSFSVVFQALFASLFGPMGFWLGSTAAALVCCNAHAAWTHATIAAPSDKSFFQRFLPAQVSRTLVLPTLRLHATIGMMKFAVVSLSQVAIYKTSVSKHPHVTAHLGFLPIIVGAIMALGMVLPSYIALIRAEASVLPEDMFAIVPFDRTFGGRFLQIVEETSTDERVSACALRRVKFIKAMTIRGAYMTFNRDTYRRTLRMLGKFVMVSSAVVIAFIGVVVAEVFIIAGGSENVHKGLEIMHAIQRGEL